METQEPGFALGAAPEGGGPQVVELWGALEPGVIEALDEALDEALQRAPAAASRLLVRLERVTACSAKARARWVALQRRLAQRGARTAYLDPRPWGRGLALDVVHRAEDPRALAVASPARAQAWLEGTQERLADALALLGVRP